MEYIDDIKREVQRLLSISRDSALASIEALVNNIRGSSSAARVQALESYLRDIDVLLTGTTEQAITSIKPRLQTRIDAIAAEFGVSGTAETAAFSEQLAETLAESVRSNMLAVKDVAVSGQSEMVARMLSGGDIPQDAVTSLNKALGHKFESQTITVMDTNLAAIDRKVNIETAASLGLEVFEYTGPNDGATRPWCKQTLKGHSPGLAAGQYYLDDMKALTNDVGPNPASIFGGGWECRHDWTGIEVL